MGNNTYLHGSINFSKIPRDMLTQNKNGEAVLWCDIFEKQSPDKYGNTHYIKVYNKQTRQTIYLGDFRIQEFRSQPGSGDAYRGSIPGAQDPSFAVER